MAKAKFRIESYLKMAENGKQKRDVLPSECWSRDRCVKENV